MSKTVTLRLDRKVYDKFRSLAERDNRPLSNFIETAAVRFVESEQFVDEFEMDEIRANKRLNESLRRGRRDARARRGRFA
jgi:predicted transcriptional regulator